jgi:leucyl/phenylalanyl-tRNA--protein transferase
MMACAEPRPGKTPLTWITKNIIEAYCSLFKEGWAHSVEVWDESGQLIGGLYGVAIGRLFINESMFLKRPNASKIGLAFLNCHLQAWGYMVHDIKGYNAFWKAQGARMIPRSEFSELIRKWRDGQGRTHPWLVDETLDVANWKPKEGIMSAIRPATSYS